MYTAMVQRSLWDLPGTNPGHVTLKYKELCAGWAARAAQVRVAGPGRDAGIHSGREGDEGFGASHVQGEAEMAGTVQRGEEKAEEDLTNVPKYMMGA